MEKRLLDCYSTMRLILASLFVTVFVSVSAQELDTAKVKPPSKFQQMLKSHSAGVFGGLETQIIPGPDGALSNNSLVIGLLWDKWQIGGIYTSLSSGYSDEIIFPSQYRLEYEQGGVWIGYQILKTRWIHATLGASATYGDIMWKNDTDAIAFDSKSQWYRPTLQAKIPLFKYFGLTASTGYQIVITDEIPALTGADLSGIFFAAGLNINLRYAND